MNTLRSPHVTRAGVAVSGLAISFVGMSLANAAPKKPDGIRHPGYIKDLNCQYEESVKYVGKKYAGLLGVLKCDDTRMKTMGFIITDHPLHGHPYNLHGHGEHKSLIYESGHYRWARDAFPKSYLLRLLNQGDRISMEVVYHLEDPVQGPNHVSGSQPFVTAELTRHDLMAKPTDTHHHSQLSPTSTIVMSQP